MHSQRSAQSPSTWQVRQESASANEPSGAGQPPAAARRSVIRSARGWAAGSGDSDSHCVAKGPASPCSSRQRGVELVTSSPPASNVKPNAQPPHVPPHEPTVALPLQAQVSTLPRSHTLRGSALAFQVQLAGNSAAAAGCRAVRAVVPLAAAAATTTACHRGSIVVAAPGPVQLLRHARMRGCGARRPIDNERDDGGHIRIYTYMYYLYPISRYLYVRECPAGKKFSRARRAAAL